MIFYTLSGQTSKYPSAAEFPCVTLRFVKWDDFGYRTSFFAHLWENETDSIELGSVKILQKDKKGAILARTSLPRKFTSLARDYYCSLGQERKYYEELKKYENGREILWSLKDIVLNPDAAYGFDDDEIFEQSLLRFSEAIDNYHNAGELFGRSVSPGQIFESKSSRELFTFTYQFEGFSAPHKVKCDFLQHNDLPSRIIAFVGKNGTGKTAVMSKMAEFFSGINEEEITKEIFSPKRPSFSRTVVVSYSPFGPFRYPLLETSSYRYCGLLNNNEQVDLSFLKTRTIEGIFEIFKLGRLEFWVNAIRSSGLFDNEPLMVGMGASIDSIMREYYGDESDRNRLFGGIYEIWEKMSSGHYYVALLLTDIVANLLKDSVLLIDEPELYLHPNMVSGLMRAIEELLNHTYFDSYAIVATHSPIVVQELLGRSVRIFSRIGNEPHCLPLDFESFGENLTTLVNQVFGVTRDDKNYMRILEQLSQGKTKEEVDALFNNELGMNALSFVGAIIKKNKEH
jgi:predicted ATPase